MLLVKTKLGISPIHGVGLFADEVIPKGTIIWKYHPELDRAYTDEDLKSFDEESTKFLITYCFKYSGKYYLCVDNARFMNHSENPSCVDVGDDSVTETDMGYTMTGRDIQVGEELTCDYSGFGSNHSKESDNEFNTKI